MNQLQFICVKKHDRVSPIPHLFATLHEIFAICAVWSHSTDGTLHQQTLGKHLFVADDGWPRLEALHYAVPILTRLYFKVQVWHGLLSAEVFLLVLRNSSCRLALLFLGCTRCAIGRGGRGGYNIKLANNRDFDTKSSRVISKQSLYSVIVTGSVCVSSIEGQSRRRR